MNVVKTNLLNKSLIKRSTFFLLFFGLIFVSGCTKDKTRNENKSNDEEISTETGEGKGISSETGERNASHDSKEASSSKINPNRIDPNRQPLPPVTQISYKKLSGPLTLDQIKQWADQDRIKHSSDSQYLRYTYIPPAMAADANQANIARVGLWKAMNHVIQDLPEEQGRPSIYVGRDASEGHGLLYAIDVRQMWGTQGVLKWGWVARARAENHPFGFFPTKLRERAFPELEPVAATQLVYNALHSTVYNDLIGLPDSEGQFRNPRLGVPYNSVLGFFGVHEAIVIGPRVAWVSRTKDGRLYWATGDEFNGDENANLRYLGEGVDPRVQFQNGTHRIVIRPPGTPQSVSEAWYEGHNGFPRYMIWGEGNQNRAVAEYAFVSDPGNKINQRLITGRSCITCHVNGVQMVKSDMATAIANNNIPPEYMDVARKMYFAQPDLDALYLESYNKFRTAMTRIVSSVSDGSQEFNAQLIQSSGGEPINVLINAWEFPNRQNGSRQD